MTILKMEVILLPLAVLEALLEISNERVEYYRGVVTWSTVCQVGAEIEAAVAVAVVKGCIFTR